MKIQELLEDYLEKSEATTQYLKGESFSADVYNQLYQEREDALKLLMKTLNGRAYLLPNSNSVLCPDNDGFDYSILELVRDE